MQRKALNVQAMGKKQTRILVVEEDAGVATVLGARLERFGYLVCDLVCTGREAIASTRRHQPDLILMDTHLEEGMNGIEAAEHIGRENDVPIIFMAYPAVHGVVGLSVKTSPYGYLVKPYDYVELRLNIEMALFKHRAAKEREDLEARLEEALQEVRKLSSLLLSCISGEDLGDDNDSWREMKNHIASRSGSALRQGICRECSPRLEPELYPIRASTDH